MQIKTMVLRIKANIKGGTGLLPSAQALTAKLPAQHKQHSIKSKKSETRISEA